MSETMIYVKWVDSALTSDWTEAPNSKTGVVEIESIGYLILEDDEHIEIAQNMSTFHKCAIMAIPKAVIKERKELRIRNK